MSDQEESLLVELRGPFNGCCFKERCISWIETLERENLNLLHDQEKLEREVAELREKMIEEIHVFWGVHYMANNIYVQKFAMDLIRALKDKP